MRSRRSRWLRVARFPLLLLVGCRPPPPASTDVTMAPLPAASARAVEGTPRPPPSISLRFVPVDDQTDPFLTLEQDSAALPEGVFLETELVTLGEGPPTERRYARVSPTRDESVEAALARTRPFFAKVILPPKESLSFQRLVTFDADDHRRDTGFRTFVLGPLPIITESDVQAATTRAPDDQMPMWTVNIELTRSGSERFRTFTRDHIGRRMAIVENGMVMSAPVIRSEIAGGRASITVGGGTPSESAETARALANALDRH